MLGRSLPCSLAENGFNPHFVHEQKLQLFLVMKLLFCFLSIIPTWTQNKLAKSDECKTFTIKAISLYLAHKTHLQMM